MKKWLSYNEYFYGWLLSLNLILFHLNFAVNTCIGLQLWSLLNLITISVSSVLKFLRIDAASEGDQEDIKINLFFSGVDAWFPCELMNH